MLSAIATKGIRTNILVRREEGNEIAEIESRRVLPGRAGWFVSSNAKADAWNTATKITFPEPAKVSGHVLQAGTYWFQLTDSRSDHNLPDLEPAGLFGLALTINGFTHDLYSRVRRVLGIGEADSDDGKARCI